MPSRLSKVFSRSKSDDKEKEALAEAERNASSLKSSPPPSYAQRPEYDEEDTEPPPDITTGFSNLNLSSSTSITPTHAETIAHLKVLEAFYRLRQNIGSTDGLYGISNSTVTSLTPSNDEQSELLARLAEKRWAIYLTKAVGRFEKWTSAVFLSYGCITTSILSTDGETGRLVEPGYGAQPIAFTRDVMPPIDILMVWHAYMLNPRAYLEDCIRFGRMQMWHTPFPWKAAVECIDSKTFEYVAGNTDLIAKGTTTIWDDLKDSPVKKIRCPHCPSMISAPWTTCTNQAPQGKYYKASDSINAMLSSGDGYADPDFRATCDRCAAEITHKSLQASKFRSDVESLMSSDVPMAGTILGGDGIPAKVLGVTDYSCKYFTKFPNNLLKAGLGAHLLSKPTLSVDQSLETIRDVIEEGLADKSLMHRALGKVGHRPSRHERVAIRKMMSRYWDNASPFSLDLVGAVIRQGSFIEKMHNIDWLHSPALPNTMKRLLVKYSNFFEILKDKFHMAVPTLDVDLAWHTHQLSPWKYMQHSLRTTKTFVDHDDKVAETKLNDSFAWTSKTYQKMFGEPYSECTCWYCEAVRESHTSAASRLFSTGSAQANDKLHAAEQDPRKSVHISAHNAVRPQDDTDKYQLVARQKADALEKHYQKACDRARKKGRSQPKRNDYYYSDAYGYPVFMPAYSPYMGYWGVYPGMYAVNPGCMAVGAGMAGNCAAGTCGGGVAAGSCGSMGSGGCAAGATGGCGSGGAGCGGGSGAAGGCGSGGGGGCGGGGGS